MTISCWKWLKTAIDGGSLWSTAPQPRDDDDDDDDEPPSDEELQKTGVKLTYNPNALALRFLLKKLPFP